MVKSLAWRTESTTESVTAWVTEVQQTWVREPEAWRQTTR
jgi:hypothetical protein